MFILRTIRASEIGTFLYCQRAWWYRAQGVVSQNQTELTEGTQFHQAHGRQVFTARMMRLAGWLLLLGALVILAIGLTLYFLP